MQCVELYRQEFIIYTRELLLREDLVSFTGIFLNYARILMPLLRGFI
jgi:hypothetical protein